jgi:L-amino acid N-acyltransferase YncA
LVPKVDSCKGLYKINIQKLNDNKVMLICELFMRKSTAMSKVIIEEMNAKSWDAVRRIYNAGIATKNATFQTEAPEWEAWDQAHRKDCRLIARTNDQITGWAALSNVSGRCVYAGVAEVSVYIDPSFKRMGIGDQLMKQLIAESEKHGIWTLQAGIFPENKASIALHLKNGFKILGIREKIGKMDNIWRDTAMLERRSKVVGIE